MYSGANVTIPQEGTALFGEGLQASIPSTRPPPPILPGYTTAKGCSLITASPQSRRARARQLLIAVPPVEVVLGVFSPCRRPDGHFLSPLRCRAVYLRYDLLPYLHTRPGLFACQEASRQPETIQPEAFTHKSPLKRPVRWFCSSPYSILPERLSRVRCVYFTRAYFQPPRLSLNHDKVAP